MSIKEFRGMVDVKSKKCVHEDCKIIPSYNDEGKRKSIFCSVHKKDGMFDVISDYKKVYTRRM